MERAINCILDILAGKRSKGEHGSASDGRLVRTSDENCRKSPGIADGAERSYCCFTNEGIIMCRCSSAERGNSRFEPSTYPRTFAECRCGRLGDVRIAILEQLAHDGNQRAGWALSYKFADAPTHGRIGVVCARVEGGRRSRPRAALGQDSECRRPDTRVGIFGPGSFEFRPFATRDLRLGAVGEQICGARRGHAEQPTS